MEIITNFLVSSTLVMSSAGAISAGTIVDYDFAAAEGWSGNSVQELKDVSWTVNTAANSDTAFYVDPSYSNSSMSGVLWVKDNVFHASDDNLGTPRATLNFGAVTEGSLAIRAAGGGAPQHNGRILLLAGMTELAQVRIIDNSAATVITGNGTTSLPAPAGGTWNQNGQNLEFSWTVANDGTGGLLTVRLNGVAVVSNHAFLAAGVPNTVGLQAGFREHTGRGMIVDSLLITAVPEPASAALALLGGALMASVRRRG